MKLLNETGKQIVAVMIAAAFAFLIVPPLMILFMHYVSWWFPLPE